MNKRSGRIRPQSGRWMWSAACLAGAAIAAMAWIAEHRPAAQAYPEDQTVIYMKSIEDFQNASADLAGLREKGDGKKPVDDESGAAAGQDPSEANPDSARAADGAGHRPGRAQERSEQASLLVRVYLTEEKRIEQVPLETYVRGVVAAEMPLDFQPAALEAQAIAARTYLIRRLWTNDRSGVPVRGADVTDTVTHQVYKSLKQMEQLKADDRKHWDKLDQAVRNTRGLVMTYDGQPIQALFFASTDGYTEASETVFGDALPYLRPVASPWDAVLAPTYEETVEIPLSDLYRKLGIDAEPAMAQGAAGAALKIVKKAAGHRVRAAAIGSRTFSGEQLREKLGLRSTSFTWSVKRQAAVITTYGNGHGVGMSQWGAEGMARKGMTAENIVKHYYTGIELKNVSELIR